MVPSAAEVDGAVAVLRRVVGSVEPGELIPDQAARLVEQLARAVDTALAALAIVSERAEESSRWRSGGSRRFEDWLAKAAGLSFGDAVHLLDGSRRLRVDPGGVLAQLRRGTMPGLTAGPVLEGRDAALEADRRAADAAAAEARRRAEAGGGEEAVDLFGEPAAACPGRSAKEIEAELIRKAQERNLAEVKAAARKQKAAAADAETRRRSQLLNRCLHDRGFDDGSGGHLAKMPPAQAALVDALIGEEAKRIAQERQAAGLPHLGFPAYRVDALCRLLGVDPPDDKPAPAAAPAPVGEPTPAPAAAPVVKPRGRPKLKARIDLSALRRGRTLPGDVSETKANGPSAFVDVEALQPLLASSNLFLAVRDDVRTISVTHLGRRRPRGTPDYLLPRGGPPPARVVGVLRVHVSEIRFRPFVASVEVPGVGEVCLPALEQLLGPKLAAFVAARAVDVHGDRSTAREFANEIRIAVEEDQHTCIDCGNPWSLEHDHKQAHALDGESTYANDGLRCPACHLTKTKAEAKQTIRAGLLRKRGRVP